MPRNAGGVGRGAGRGWFGLALGSLTAGVAIGLLGRGLADYWAELVLRASKILGCPQVIGLQAGLVEPRVWSQVGSIGLWATRSKGWGESKFGPRVQGWMVAGRVTLRVAERAGPRLLWASCLGRLKMG